MLDDDGHDFGNVVRQERVRQGLTIAELAERAALPVELVERVEAGQHDPYLREAVRLADALGATIGGLVDAAVGG